MEKKRKRKKGPAAAELGLPNKNKKREDMPCESRVRVTGVDIDRQPGPGTKSVRPVPCEQTTSISRSRSASSREARITIPFSALDQAALPFLRLQLLAAQRSEGSHLSQWPCCRPGRGTLRERARAEQPIRANDRTRREEQVVSSPSLGTTTPVHINISPSLYPPWAHPSPPVFVGVLVLLAHFIIVTTGTQNA